MRAFMEPILIDHQRTSPFHIHVPSMNALYACHSLNYTPSVNQSAVSQSFSHSTTHSLSLSHFLAQSTTHPVADSLTPSLTR